MSMEKKAAGKSSCSLLSCLTSSDATTFSSTRHSGRFHGVKKEYTLQNEFYMKSYMSSVLPHIFYGGHHEVGAFIFYCGWKTGFIFRG